MTDILTDDNFLLYCASHYDNSRYCSTEEFLEDLNRLKYVKKLVTRYVESGDLKERLILNHIIILNNCFGPEALCKILWLKLKDQLIYIKPFLVLLNILPDQLMNVGESSVIHTDDVIMDSRIIERLRAI